MVVNDDVGCLDSCGVTEFIAGRPAPTGIVCEHRVCEQAQNTVGAGLPAMAVCQATGMLDVMASSLAGQLPQGSEVAATF
jgi:hypothetical protein